MSKRKRVHINFGIGLLISLVVAAIILIYSVDTARTTAATSKEVIAYTAAATADRTEVVPDADVATDEENLTAHASSAAENSANHTEEKTVATAESAPQVVPIATSTDTGRFTVPFYSQFTDITPVSWQKIGCGIASLAMLVDFYEPAVAVDTLLEEGIASGAYIKDAGWSHQGLINLAQKYGLNGEAHSYAHKSMDDAFSTLVEALAAGPVMVSVHYTFDPQNPIPHLVVITGVHDGLVYYNDPAEVSGDNAISITQFQSAWKKRHIAIRP